MADDIFAFQTPPFAAEGSAKFLYLDAPRRRILADLIAHVCDGEGPILLVAEPGMGKTMLLDRLADEANAHNIRIVFSITDVATIVAATEADPQPPTAFLLDDGNALPLGVWHQLIALLRSASPSPPGTPSRRLPPIIIALTPDLLDWLIDASLVPRNTPLDRVFRLPPFASRDVGRYIALRLRVAGIDRPEVFTADSVDRIALAAEGVPARINRICEAALDEAARRGRTDVSTEIVEAAAARIEWEAPKPLVAATPPPIMPEQLIQSQPAAEPPVPPVGSAPSIGIVGSGYAPVDGTQTVRRRMRRRRVPRWAGVAVAVGVAGVGAMAMLGYVTAPNVPRPAASTPGSATGDAAMAALETTPLRPPTGESSLGATGPVPILTRPDERVDRSADLHRNAFQGSAEDPPVDSSKDAFLPTSPEIAAPAPAAPIQIAPAAPAQSTPAASVQSAPAAPVQIAPAAPVQIALAAPAQSAPAASVQSAPAAPVQTAPTPAPARELAVTARPAPAGRPTAAAPAAEQPQPRAGHPRGGDTAVARRHERSEEPVNGGEAEPSDIAAATDEGRPRPVKEIIAMGDEFRDAGDTEWARRLYRAAQQRGSTKAAIAMAETYDPQYAAASSRPDPDEARRLYSEAARQGDRQAAKRLEELDQWMSERSSR